MFPILIGSRFIVSKRESIKNLENSADKLSMFTPAHLIIWFAALVGGHFAIANYDKQPITGNTHMDRLLVASLPSQFMQRSLPILIAFIFVVSGVVLADPTVKFSLPHIIKTLANVIIGASLVVPALLLYSFLEVRAQKNRRWKLFHLLMHNDFQKFPLAEKIHKTYLRLGTHECISNGQFFKFHFVARELTPNKQYCLVPLYTGPLSAWFLSDSVLVSDAHFYYVHKYFVNPKRQAA